MLHAVEVLWESLSDDDGSTAAAESSGPDEQLCLALSKATSNGIPVVMLIDSGSSTSFLSSSVASQLPQFRSVT